MIGNRLRKGHRVGRNFLHTAATRFTYQVHTRCGRTFPGDSLKIEQGHQNPYPDTKLNPKPKPCP